MSGAAQSSRCEQGHGRGMKGSVTHGSFDDRWTGKLR
jgi:hypothetical protein